MLPNYNKRRLSMDFFLCHSGITCESESGQKSLENEKQMSEKK